MKLIKQHIRNELLYFMDNSLQDHPSHGNSQYLMLNNHVDSLFVEKNQYQAFKPGIALSDPPVAPALTFSMQTASSFFHASTDSTSSHSHFNRGKAQAPAGI